MDHFKKIYATKATEYHQMILPEDVDGNLISTIKEITPLENARLLDLGSGTGRIPLLTHHLVSQLVALDLNYPMLAEQHIHRQDAGGTWMMVQGDNRGLPLPDDSFDVVTAGWAIGHLRSWYAADWQTQIGSILGRWNGSLPRAGT